MRRAPFGHQALKLLDPILGGGMGGNIFQKLGLLQVLLEGLEKINHSLRLDVRGENHFHTLPVRSRLFPPAIAQ